MKLNLFILVVALPALIMQARRSGAAGVAEVWPALNALNLLVGVPATVRAIQVASVRGWIGRVVIVPGATCTACVLLLRFVVPMSGHVVVLALQLGAIWFVSMLALVASSHELRATVPAMIQALGRGDGARPIRT